MPKRKVFTIRDLRLPPEVEKALHDYGGYRRLRASLPPKETFDEEAQRHLVLSDPQRLIILGALRQCDLCPCVLKEIGNMTDSKLSYHLNKLEEAGMVEAHQNGTWKVYSLTPIGRKATTVKKARPIKKK